MSRQPGIWSRLQEYELSPPQGAFDKICASVNTDDQTSISKEPVNTDNDQLQGSIKRLRAFDIQPPAALRSLIDRRISEVMAGSSVWPDAFPRKDSTTIENRATIEDRPTKLNKKRFRYYGIRSVAACLVLALAGWLLYRATLFQRTTLTIPDNRISGSPKDAAPRQPERLSNKDSLSKTDSLTGENALANNAAGKDVDGQPVGGKYYQPASFQMNGQNFALTDNDLLATWVSFTYTEIPEFINHPGETVWKIHIDQYTNILISKPMSEMMKEMNTFRSNGDPTRKARKSREKLGKWKKADQEQFDRSLQKNPLDPIDLAEFIFK